MAPTTWPHNTSISARGRSPPTTRQSESPSPRRQSGSAGWYRPCTPGVKVRPISGQRSASGVVQSVEREGRIRVAWSDGSTKEHAVSDLVPTHVRAPSVAESIKGRSRSPRSPPRPVRSADAERGRGRRSPPRAHYPISTPASPQHIIVLPTVGDTVFERDRNTTHYHRPSIRTPASASTPAPPDYPPWPPPAQGGSGYGSKAPPRFATLPQQQQEQQQWHTASPARSRPRDSGTGSLDPDIVAHWGAFPEHTPSNGGRRTASRVVADGAAPLDNPSVTDVLASVEQLQASLSAKLRAVGESFTNTPPEPALL
eukprot:Sspe_Gene.21025::Locus_7813_Transcript_1_1_Confidence_1.000_Length_1555::g.21025::m.21025